MSKFLDVTDAEMDLARCIARACIGYQMGVSDATAKKYVPKDAPVGDIWIAMVRFWAEAQRQQKIGE